MTSMIVTQVHKIPRRKIEDSQNQIVISANGDGHKIIQLAQNGNISQINRFLRSLDFKNKLKSRPQYFAILMSLLKSCAKHLAKKMEESNEKILDMVNQIDLFAERAFIVDQ